MAIEVIRDEGGAEQYTGHVPDYPEPDSEPRCWTHHSNSCGCPEGTGIGRGTDPDTGEPYGYSAEPPFLPDDYPRPAIDLDLEPLFWAR